ANSWCMVGARKTSVERTKKGVSRRTRSDPYARPAAIIRIGQPPLGFVSGELRLGSPKRPTREGGHDGRRVVRALANATATAVAHGTMTSHGAFHSGCHSVMSRVSLTVSARNRPSP